MMYSIWAFESFDPMAFETLWGFTYESIAWLMRYLTVERLICITLAIDVKLRIGFRFYLKWTCP